MTRTSGLIQGSHVTWAGSLAMAAWLALAGSVAAQSPSNDGTPEGIMRIPTVVETNPQAGIMLVPAEDNAEVSGVEQAGCTSCGSGGMTTPLYYRYYGGHGCGSCGVGGCVPGRHCDPMQAHTAVGRFFACLYNCTCCPDPCYEPMWIPAANASFFADSARPVTQMRLRWDTASNYRFPDRSEYFWARQQIVQLKRTPAGQIAVPVEQVFLNPQLDNGQPCPRPSVAKGPKSELGEPSVDYREFTYYTEAAIGAFSAFVEVPYRRVEPDATACAFSGFADMIVGTKSLLLDCELLQIAFQFKTFLPIGQADRGLGTNRVSLEPSLLFTVRMTEKSYFQAQAAYFIPINGDQYYAGDLFHYHLSVNKLLACSPQGQVQLIATGELNGWQFLDGAYTDPTVLQADAQAPLGVVPTTQNARDHFLSAGPGLRLVICDKIDFGVGTAFRLTQDGLIDDLYRAEFRWRF